MATQRIAYMTVDDAPTSAMIPKLECFLKHKIPAVWYLKGRDLSEMPEMGVELLKAGHPIGNHAWDHPYFSKIPLDKAKESILRTHEVLEEVHAKAKKPFVKIFRFPYGDKGAGQDCIRSADPVKQAHMDAIQAYLRKLGYSQPKFHGVTYKWYNDLELGTDRFADSYWTYQFKEWEAFVGPITEEEILGWMDKDEPDRMFGLNSGTSAEILLLHDHPETNRFYPRVVEKIAKKGFRFELPEMPKA